MTVKRYDLGDILDDLEALVSARDKDPAKGVWQRELNVHLIFL